MNEPAVYAFHGATVRIHTDGDQIEYCARDVAAEIGRASCRERV